MILQRRKDCVISLKLIVTSVTGRQLFHQRVYVERTVLETGVASAVIYFNKGMQGLIPVFKELGMEMPGHYTLKGLQQSDVSRVKEMNRKSLEPVKKR